MPLTLSFVTNFNDTAVRLQRLEQALPVRQRELLDALLPRFVAIQEDALRRETPFNERGYGEYGNAALPNERLADTTRSDIIRAGSNQFQSQALVQTYQTKEVTNSRGERFELSDVIVRGRNTEDKTPIVPAVKGALWSPDLGGPYASVKGSIAPPDDYFQRARDAALPEIEVAAAAGVADMADSLFTLR